MCTRVGTRVLVRQHPQDPFPTPEASLESGRQPCSQGSFQRPGLRPPPPATRRPTSLPVKRHGARVGTVSSSYASETLLKCFWARSSSCRCSTPAETEGAVMGRAAGAKAQGQGDHAQAEDPTSDLGGRWRKEDTTSGQGQGRESSRERLCLMGGAGTSRSKSVHHLSPREAAARWAERWVPSRCILPHIKNKTGAPWAPGHLPCFVPLTLPQADAGCYPVGEANERAQRCYCRAVTNSGDVHEEHSGPCKTAHPHLYKGRSLPLEHLGWSALWAARETACQRPRPSFLPSQSSHPSGLNSLTLTRLNCPWVTGPMATNHALPSSPFHLPGCQGHKLEKHP